MTKHKYMCPECHVVQLQDNELMCWRCRTRTLAEITERRPQNFSAEIKSGSFKGKSVIIQVMSEALMPDGTTLNVCVKFLMFFPFDIPICEN